MEGKPMSEQITAPYASPNRGRVRIPHLRQMKARGQKWAMLTAMTRTPQPYLRR
jgi:hypothetical protein